MLNGNRMKSERGRNPRDLYITPPELACAALVQFDINEHPHKSLNFGLDAGCGNGVWGKYATQLIDFVYGIDLLPTISKEDEGLFKAIYSGDFLHLKNKDNEYGYHFIFGNPPYSLAEEFIVHSFELLEPDGYIYFLLRLSFLEGIKRGRTLFDEYNLKRVSVCSRRPSFYSSDGKRHTTDTMAYAMFLWQKGFQGRTDLAWLDWEYKDERTTKV